MSKIVGLRKKINKKNKKKIVLPEGEDQRVIKAASFLAEKDLADIYLIGNKKQINDYVKKQKLVFDNVKIIEPKSYKFHSDIVNTYFELRKKKGITIEKAEQIITDIKTFYAALMTRLGFVDGFVAGAYYKTSDVARSAIQCLKIDKKIGSVSSCFIMEIEDCNFGEKGLFAYADCAIIPVPNIRQFVGISISTSDLFSKLFDITPKVAMLSYSTKGSAKTDSTENILQSINKIKEKKPNLIIDGELQVDAAIIPKVANMKCPNSQIKGNANILIFPNLEAGNISYKLTQRLCKSKAIGPIMQGLDKPCSDLSRGCNWEDIVDTTVITAIRAQTE